jgi:pSer/pThr/pTyr-binding forkhead associated (FHA) protein
VGRYPQTRTSIVARLFWAHEFDEEGKDGRQISIGNPSKGLISMNKMLVLEVSLLGQVIKRYGFTKDVITVGRDSHSDVLLDHPAISRSHLRIERKSTGFMLRDTTSSNGTFVNRSVCKRRRLRTGDLIQINRYVLTVGIDDVPATAEQDGHLRECLTVRMHSPPPHTLEPGSSGC